MRGLKSSVYFFVAFIFSASLLLLNIIIPTFYVGAEYGEVNIEIYKKENERNYKLRSYCDTGGGINFEGSTSYTALVNEGTPQEYVAGYCCGATKKVLEECERQKKLHLSPDGKTTWCAVRGGIVFNANKQALERKKKGLKAIITPVKNGQECIYRGNIVCETAIKIGFKQKNLLYYLTQVAEAKEVSLKCLERGTTGTNSSKPPKKSAPLKTGIGSTGWEGRVPAPDARPSPLAGGGNYPAKKASAGADKSGSDGTATGVVDSTEGGSGTGKVEKKEAPKPVFEGGREVGPETKKLMRVVDPKEKRYAFIYKDKYPKNSPGANQKVVRDDYFKYQDESLPNFYNPTGKSAEELLKEAELEKARASEGVSIIGAVLDNFANLAASLLDKVLPEPKAVQEAKELQRKIEEINKKQKELQRQKETYKVRISYNPNDTKAPEVKIVQEPEVDLQEERYRLEKLSSELIAQKALKTAKEEAILIQNSTTCDENEEASRCLVKKLEKAKMQEREIFKRELENSGLSSSTIQYYLDVYDGKIDPKVRDLPIMEKIKEVKEKQNTVNSKTQKQNNTNSKQNGKNTTEENKSVIQKGKEIVVRFWEKFKSWFTGK